MKKSLIFMLICWVTFPTYAVSVHNLYDINMSVEKQSDASREMVFRTGLTSILKRVSGDPNIFEHPEIKVALGQPAHYVQEYDYQHHQQADQSVLSLHVLFSEKMVRKLLASANIAVWGSARPSTVMWLVLDNQGSRQIISEESIHEAPIINVEAAQRGVPVILPLMDLQEQQTVRPSHVWGNFMEVLTPASQRYGSDLILVGRIDGDEIIGWQGHWQLSLPKTDVNWESQAHTKEALLSDLISNLAERLAEQYAVFSVQDPDAMLLSVDNVTGAARYASIEQYLSNLVSVRSVRVVKVTGTSVLFSIMPSKDKAAVEKDLALGLRLSPVPSEVPGQLAAVDNIYHYHMERNPA